MEWLRNLGNAVLNAIPGILAAILILVVAYLVASLARWLIIKLLKALKLEEKINRAGVTDSSKGNTLTYLGKLVFIIVFILFLPSVFSRLGLSAVADPITSMVSSILGFIPNIIATVLILLVGYFVAKVIRQLLEPLLKRLGVDKIQQKHGLTTEPRNSLSHIISYIVFVLIMIPIIIAALEALQIRAISEPAILMLDTIFSFIPQILAAAVLIGLGVYVGKIIGRLLTELLTGIGLDKYSAKLDPDHRVIRSNFSMSHFIGVLVQVLIVLFFTVEGLNVIQLDVLQTIGAAIIAYLPNVLGAVLILAAAYFFASWLQLKLTEKLAGGRSIGLLTKIIIMVIAIFMVLDQLKLGSGVISYVLLLVIAGAALAFALAFGLGGRDFARHYLSKAEHKLDDIQPQETETFYSAAPYKTEAAEPDQTADHPES
ncbi:mechanosensitive ion channel [Oscillospiraceae bacterium HV4-5-C5C]|nr:mechanosensitive ion channel [Oscillospiraceae bacterium HV4-5-C5C]